MPETSLNWADRIQQAAESENKFKELEPGEYNFSIEKVEVKPGAKGDFLNLQMKVLDGPRANARAFGRAFPNSNTPGGIAMFLRFLEAVGIDKAWLVSSDPSTQTIADALVDRKLSAEIYIEEGAQVNQKTGEQYRSVRNYKPQAGVAPTQVASAPAPQAQNLASAPAPSGGSPWGGQTETPSSAPGKPW